MQVVERSSLVSVLFRIAFNHPYFSFFHLLVNIISVTCIYVYCGQKKLNRTLAIDLPFQAVELLPRIYRLALPLLSPERLSSSEFSYIM